MPKNNKSQATNIPAGSATVLGVIILLIGSYLGKWNYTIFGYWPPIEFANSLHSILALLAFVFGLAILFNRKKLTYNDLGRMAAFLISLFLFFFGWKLTSVGVGMYNIQNDGLNVTGGFMMFFSGLYIGYMAKNNGR